MPKQKRTEEQELPELAYPRPQFYRRAWKSLDGPWGFAFDDEDQGLAKLWYQKSLDREIQVPFCYQSKKSGIGDLSHHNIVWYQKKLEIPADWQGKQILIHFGAVDERFTLWLDEKYIGSHVGGFTSSAFSLGKEAGGKTVTLRVEDAQNWYASQGKQSPTTERNRCWYTPTTGIWQSVWMEPVADVYLDSVQMDPDLTARTLSVNAKISGHGEHAQLKTEIFFEGRKISEASMPAEERVTMKLPVMPTDFVDESFCWSPEHPNLFDVLFTVSDETGTSDRVQSYFGLRSLEARNHQIYLNRQPCYLRMVLDQGYWAESLMTPPEAGSLKADVEMTKAFGFNGARKHQKIEDERYYYWADRLGLAVTAEMPSPYSFCPEEIGLFTQQWVDVVGQLRNHPSIIGWVPFNESWGIRDVLVSPQQKAFAEGIYELTRALEPTRFVSTNDGWEQVKADLCCVHDYYADSQEFLDKYADLDALLGADSQGRALYADGCRYEGQPIILSEYGGVAFGSFKDGWGYHEIAADEKEFLGRVKDVTEVIGTCSRITGYCYTQLTDVQQEINGLTDENHKPKADPKKIREIFEK